MTPPIILDPYAPTTEAPTLVDAHGRPFDRQAPAFNGRAPHEGFKPHELVRIDVENVPHDETGYKCLATYLVPPGLQEVFEPEGWGRRYWAIEHRLMVGGVICDVSDAMRLVRDYGITHVLSFDDAHSDDGKWQQRTRACCPFTQYDANGGLLRSYTPAVPSALGAAVRWIQALPPEAVVYAHGRRGQVRGPCAAYLVLRVRHGLTREDAQRRCGRGDPNPDHPWGVPMPPGILWYLDKAIREVCGR